MIKHFLKDGTEVASIEGMTIKYKENPRFYEAIDRIDKRLREENPDKTA